MGRLIIGITIAGLLWAAVPCQAVPVPGYTATECKLYKEFQTDLEKKKVPRDEARLLALSYLRRAYAVRLEQAQSLASDLLHQSGQMLSKDERNQYFAWGLDALERGANLNDIIEMNAFVLSRFAGGSDKTFFMEQCLRSAGRYAPAVPLAKLAAAFGNDGLVGQRRRDAILWAVDQIARGESAAQMLAMREIISKQFFTGASQAEQLKKYYASIQQGVTPESMISVLQELAKRSTSERTFQENYDKVMKLYASGKKFDDAVKTILPPPKEPKEPKTKY